MPRAASLLVIIMFMLTSPGLAGSASAVVTVHCSGNSYSTCIQAGYTAHGFENSYNNSHWGAFAGHNCTNYAAYMASQNGAPTPNFQLGNAVQWAGNAQAHGVAVDGSTAVGAIAYWNAGQGVGADGHVAYVEAVSSTSVTVSEDNYPLGPFRWRTISTGDAVWPDAFIHFSDISPPIDTRQWQWHLSNVNADSGAATAYTYGSYAHDHPIRGDWDGNGTTTAGIVRNLNGEWQWHLRNDNSDGGAYTSFNFGLASDHPITGDWDANGSVTPGIVRNVGGAWHWHLRNDNSAGGAFVSFSYGLVTTDRPIVGDWNADNADTPGVTRNINGIWQWHLRNTAAIDGGTYVAFEFGAVATDIPMPADWDGNGTTTPGIVRASGNVWQWHIRSDNSTGGAYTAFSFGSTTTDHPITGDWNADGTETPGIVRVST